MEVADEEQAGRKDPDAGVENIVRTERSTQNSAADGKVNNGRNQVWLR